VSTILKLSDGAALALHAMVLMASRPEKPLSAPEMARRLGASEAHLSKILQHLSRAGLAKSIRGPKGGFLLDKDPRKITLLQVYEVIDGRFAPSDCLFGRPICGGKSCILGDLLKSVNKEVKRYLSRARLSELTAVYRGKKWRSEGR